jgi:cytochrome c peroxidase
MEMGLPAESALEPFAPLPREPASDARIALGKYLFFDSRLSGNVSLSCASCHQPDKAFTDGRALSKGYPSTQYFRNTPMLLNTVYQSRLYWDGRMDGNDMPTLIRDHITEAHFMSMDGRLMIERLKQVPEYVEMFNNAFGGSPSFGSVLNAITAYVQSLNSPATAYDKYQAGDVQALSADAQAGLALFEGKANCARCHSRPLFSDQEFYNNGVAANPAMLDDPERHVTFRRFFRTLGAPNYRNLREDVGLYALTIQEEDRSKFRTPSLREVGRTAPYMHNGSLETLEEVVNFYNQGGGPDQTAGLQPLGLSDEEMKQLVAFLESLSSEPIQVVTPMLPDYGLVALGAGEELQAAAPPAPAPSPTPAAAPVAASKAVVAVVNKGTCNACHVIPGVPGAVGIVGPDLSNISAEAGERILGYTAEQYIRESIINPNVFTAPKCPFGLACVPGAMPANLAQTLSEDEINTIVNYLLTLTSGGQ